MKKFKRKRGFSLLEILLVLGIISGAIILALIIYPKITGANNVKTEVSNAGLIKSGVQSLYASSSNPPSNPNMNSMLIKADLIPDNMVQGTANIQNVWSGDVFVGTTTINSKTAFAIQYNHVPAAECIKMVTSASTGFDKIVVSAGKAGSAGGVVSSGGNVASGISEDGSTKIEANVANITQYCNADSSSFPTALIMFKFY